MITNHVTRKNTLPLFLTVRMFRHLNMLSNREYLYQMIPILSDPKQLVFLVTLTFQTINSSELITLDFTWTSDVFVQAGTMSSLAPLSSEMVPSSF